MSHRKKHSSSHRGGPSVPSGAPPSRSRPSPRSAGDLRRGGEAPGGVTARFVKFAKTPKAVVLGALVLLTLVGGVTHSGQQGIPHAALAGAVGVVVDLVVALALGRKAVFSTGGLITGLIVADVLSGLTPLYVVALTAGAAVLSKHVLKRGRKPLFNPAAVGLLISLALFSGAQSWWAGMPLTSWWHLPLVLVVGVFVAVRVKKYAQVLSFFGTYFALILVMAVAHIGIPSATPADALRTPFVNAAFFLGFFMMTDPPTTPTTLRGQVQFSVIAATVSLLVFSQLGGLAYLLLGLLAGNGWTVWLGRRRSADPTRRGAKGRATPLTYTTDSVLD